MRILALSDKVVSHVYSARAKQRYSDIDLVVGCGDLPGWYLEFIVSALNVPLLYVPGNHDPDQLRVPGARMLDGRLIEHAGLRILGLGGSRRYKAEGRHQYTDAEMYLRIASLLPELMLNRIRFGRGCDLFIAHSPPYGIHDGHDLAHIGFHAFRRLIRVFKPQLMLHGHSHVARNIEVTETLFEETRIVNVYPARRITWPPATRDKAPA